MSDYWCSRKDAMFNNPYTGVWQTYNIYRRGENYSFSPVVTGLRKETASKIIRAHNKALRKAEEKVSYND